MRAEQKDQTSRETSGENADPHPKGCLKIETFRDQRSCARPLRDDGRATVRGGRDPGLSWFEARGIAALLATRVEGTSS